MTTIAKFIDLAKGDRSIRQYAKDSGVSASYINGLLQGKYIPTLKILSKLSKTAQNGITYEQLIMAVNTTVIKIRE